MLIRAYRILALLLDSEPIELNCDWSNRDLTAIQQLGGRVCVEL